MTMAARVGVCAHRGWPTHLGVHACPWCSKMFCGLHFPAHQELCAVKAQQESAAPMADAPGGGPALDKRTVPPGGSMNQPKAGE
jgi:hypothetical protein